VPWSHIKKVRPPVVKGVFVEVMSQFVKWSAGNQTVHSDPRNFTVQIFPTVSVKSVIPLDRDPCERHDNLEHRAVHDGNLAFGEWNQKTVSRGRLLKFYL